MTTSFHQSPQKAACARKHQQGSSLLEVLITMLIMSFGLLALGSLTAASLQYSKISQFQSIGSQLAAEYGDRMRGNVAGFTADNYKMDTAYSSNSTAQTVPSCANVAQCTAAEMAAIDRTEWLNSLKRRLPGGWAYVTRDTVNTMAGNIWVMWVEPNLTFDTSNLSATTTGGDQCPAASIAGLAAGAPVPRCMYFRVTL